MRLLPLLMLALAHGAGAATVALDVGHFREEPGALSARGRPEFEFNRDLALEVRAALRARGIGTRVIGADGMMSRLSSRTAAANGSDFFLSLHHDSTQPQYLNFWMDHGEERIYSDRFAGFALFVSRKNVDAEASLRCASAIGAALRGRGFAPSLYHAEPIPGESKPFADRENGVHYYDNLIVLETARSPAVLLEAGVIVNRDEELKLLSPDHRGHIAAAVADGLERCLGSTVPVRSAPQRAPSL